MGEEEILSFKCVSLTSHVSLNAITYIAAGVFIDTASSVDKQIEVDVTAANKKIQKVCAKKSHIHPLERTLILVET